MTEKELQKYLQETFPEENDSCEWKEFKTLNNFFNGKEKNDVISYVSAISNMNGGHLILGIEDGTFNIVGIESNNYTAMNAKLKLIENCTNLPSEGLEIQEYITDDSNKKVWIIAIPKHSARRPVYAHRKAFQRINDSLVEITRERMDLILSESMLNEDWSAQIIPDATIDDLDPNAINKAKEKYLEIHPEKEKELMAWDDITFLNKAKITIKGKITTTAIILLGREESEHYLLPAVCKIRWSLKDNNKTNKDFKIFSIPMIEAIEKIGTTIRNTGYSYMMPGKMFPDSMLRYDPFTLREPLNNAIAHQDYSKGARIEVVEYEDEKLIFRNEGQFIPNSIEEVIENDCPESIYRNPFLIEAMRNIHMVETEGGGIKKLFTQQKRRFFPMPNYDISQGHVICEIIGNVVDKKFAQILQGNPNLQLAEIMLLDKVQKHLPITDDAVKYLRGKGLIEGRKPKFYLSSKVVRESKHRSLKTDYIKHKGFDNKFYRKQIIEYITRFEPASRNDIADMLMPHLTGDEKERYNKVTNLLASLRKANIIKVDKEKKWVLVK